MSGLEKGGEGRRNGLTHVFLTRFNVATPGREREHRNRANWLETRFELFEQFCLPAMAAQTCQNFEWIIYFDIATPKEFRTRIEQAQQIRNFHAYFSPLFPEEGWRDSVFEVLGDRVGSTLLTTNLDNDDSLARNYVALLQEAVAGQREGASCAFNFTNGYVLSGNKLFQHRHRSNAFVNYLEPLNSKAKTCMGFRHMDLPRKTVLHQIDGPYAWLQVIHGGNVSNRTRGRLVSRRNIAADFPPSVMTGVVDPTWTEIARDRVFLEPLRVGRDLAAAIVHRLWHVGPL
jgi:hypothetical protein